jgi:membrane protein YqaA with SNARE-associated domain
MLLGLLFPNVFGKLVHYGGPGLTVLGIISSLFPIPGGLDLATILLSAQNRDRWWMYALFALVGDVIGAYLNYRVAREGGKEAVHKKISKEKAEKVFQKFEHYGGWLLLVGSWMPPPMPWIPFLAAAGALKYPIRKYLGIVAVARGMRFFAAAWVGHIYGDWIISVVSSYEREIIYAFIALGVLIGIGVLLYFKWYRPRYVKPDQDEEQPSASGPSKQRSSKQQEEHAADGGRKAG